MKRRTAVKRHIKERVLAIAPKGLENWVLGLLGDGRQRGHSYWSGDFETWEEALSDCTGYDSDAVLSRVRDALLAVQAGQAAYERDSVLFEEPASVWPLMALLFRVAAAEGNRLNVLDFGGSLGSTYFQHRGCFDCLEELTWNIVEQEHFVRCGRGEFETDQLRFFSSISECLDDQSPNVVLLSSVLPYLEEPYSVLDQIIRTEVKYILIDRTPYLLAGGRDRLTIQEVPPEVYEASYPAWFFCRDRLLRVLSERYSMCFEFEAPEGQVSIYQPHEKALFCGWLFEGK